MLTFASPNDETQANQLMQPCLIRVIDNIRKHTETLDWRSEYIEQARWPATATADQRQRVRDLAGQLSAASPAAAEEIRQQLSQLPTPTPAYELKLTQGPGVALGEDAAAVASPEEARTVTLDVWELCFGVCFSDYQPQHPVAVDPTLLYDDGEVNWMALDDKAKALVAWAIDQAIAAA